MLSSSDGVDPVSSLLLAYPTGSILLKDSLAASAHFLLPWITAAAVKQGHKVVVVAAAYSAAQHQGTLKKLGVSTAAVGSQQQQPQQQQQQQQGSVLVVSALAAVRQAEQQQQAPLQALCQQVHAAAQQITSVTDQGQQQHCTVILDSVACVSALAGGDTGQLHALLHTLAALGENLQVPYRLVLLSPSDTPGTSLLLRSVASRCHVTADIHPVQGRTAALDGSMTVNTRRAPPHIRSSQLQSSGQLSTHSAVGGNAGSSSSSSGSVLRPGWLQPGCCSVWFFRCGDVGVKWLSEVHGKELLG